MKFFNFKFSVLEFKWVLTYYIYCWDWRIGINLILSISQENSDLFAENLPDPHRRRLRSLSPSQLRRSRQFVKLAASGFHAASMYDMWVLLLLKSKTRALEVISSARYYKLPDIFFSSQVLKRFQSESILS